MARHELRLVQVTTWKSRLQENAVGTFGRDATAAVERERVSEPRAEISELSVERDFFRRRAQEVPPACPASDDRSGC
jgi:hypothetical protein